MDRYAALMQEVDACVAQGRLADAEPALRGIVQMNPREPYAWALLAQLALRRTNPAEAQTCAENALRGAANHPDYLNLLGVAHAEQNRPGDAAVAFRKSIRVRPASAEAHFNLGRLMLKQGDPATAVTELQRAFTLDPQYPGAAVTLSKALTAKGRASQALDLIARIAAERPDDPWCALEHARVLQALVRDDEAIGVLQRAAERLPAHPAVHHALATTLLAAGRLPEGWAAYRRRAASGGRVRDALPEPLSRDLRGQNLSVHWEQGYGDALFFARFVPLLRARGAHVALSVPAALETLLARAGIADEVIVSGPVPAAGELLAGDLPFLLQCADAPPPVVLEPLPERVARWRERLEAAGPGPYVGVAWRAGTAATLGLEFGRNVLSLAKRIGAEALGTALRDWPGTIVSIQRTPDDAEVRELEKAAGRAVVRAEDMNADLESALGLVAVLDCYAGVSSTNVHLAAGCGRPAVVAVPFPPEWRWMQAGAASPWFPGMRVVRQRADDGAWDDAPAALREALAPFASGAALSSRPSPQLV